MRNKWTTELMLIEIRKRLGDSIRVPKDFKYEGIDTLATFICEVHGEFQKSCYSLLKSKTPCHWCAPNHKRTWVEIEEKMELIHGKKYDYSLCQKTYMPKYKLSIICPEHGVFKQSAAEHLTGAGCRVCYEDKNRLSINTFLKNSIELHGENYDYQKVFETFRNGRSKVEIICKRHGVFTQKATDHCRGVGCPSCRSSKGEQQIERFLKATLIGFIKQKTFPDLRSLRGGYLKYDFFIPSLNCLIEYDGAQHFNEIGYFDHQKTKESDLLKDEYVKLNKILLIRIRYNEDVNQKLEALISSLTTTP